MEKGTARERQGLEMEVGMAGEGLKDGNGNGRGRAGDKSRYLYI